jgi:hypothetical protein
MSAQKSLDSQALGMGSVNEHSQTQNSSQAHTPQLVQHPPPPKRQSTASTNGHASEQTSASTTGPPSIEETSDQDADAEMDDDDSFAIMNTSPAKTVPQPMQQQATLDVLTLAS